MKSKKPLIIVWAICLMLVVAVSFVACNKEQQAPEQPPHEHSWATEWSKDSTGHWHACGGCDEKNDFTAHVYSDDHDATCNVCGYERSLGDHVASTSWTADASGHWNVCMHEGCTLVYNESEHIYSDAHDATCNVCGYVRDLGDHAAGELQSDADYHWYVCTHDGCELLFNLSEHEFDDDHDATCNVCGYVRDLGDHVAASDWSSDQTHHWKACEASNCDIKYSYSAHTFSDGVCTVCGEGQQTEGLQFTLQSGEYVVTGYTGTATDVVIRSIYCGKSVTGIDGAVFKDNTALTGITIPDSVTSIGDSAFEGCDHLASVTLGNHVESIGANAFDGCTMLTSIELPNSMTSIGDSAFKNSNLYSITIPNSVTSIGVRAFSNSGLKSITIPNSVTSIDNQAFQGCASLTTVTLGNHVESIGNNAFTNCILLESITIPDSVTSVGLRAFQGCDKLTTANIGNGVTAIEREMFKSCDILSTVYIGTGVTSIATGTFDGCTKLKSITYAGTIAQWNTISKATGWKNSQLSTIHCSGGDTTP